MTVCNMTIEGGGRAGMIAPDETTFAWLAETSAPARRSGEELRARDRALGALRTDAGAEFDSEVRSTPRAISPQVTWGTNPGRSAR